MAEELQRQGHKVSHETVAELLRQTDYSLQANRKTLEGSQHEGMIDFALRNLGPERLLFATDINFESGVGKILAANLTEPQRRMIFFDNYNNILRNRGLHAR